MSPGLFTLLLALLYAAGTVALSIVGMRKTKSLRSFALGRGDMSPYLVGITLSASIASTATFVINPGFVYADGLAAWAHYGLAGALGLTAALLVLSRGFHRLGVATDAFTLPDWLRKRYQSRGLGLFFGVISLLYVTFVVLILAGSALIAGELFGISYHVALVVLLVFVFGYVLMGGTYAHAYTNSMQGILMLVIAVALFASGAEFLDGDFGDRLARWGKATPAGSTRTAPSTTTSSRSSPAASSSPSP